MREIAIVILTVIYTLITWPIRKVNSLKEKEEKEKANYKLLRKLIKMVIRISGIKINITGKENIKDKNYLIIGNHKSNLDSLILIWIFEKPLIFIGKDELRKMPFINSWFEEIGCLFIERDNIRQSAKVIIEGSNILKNTKSVTIFPEGRRVMEDGLGEFKAGSFKMAIKSENNILPIAISNSCDALEKSKYIKPIDIKVNIGKEIDWKSMNYKNTNEICEYTVSVIEKLYKN